MCWPAGPGALYHCVMTGALSGIRYDQVWSVLMVSIIWESWEPEQIIIWPVSAPVYSVCTIVTHNADIEHSATCGKYCLSFICFQFIFVTLTIKIVRANMKLIFYLLSACSHDNPSCGISRLLNVFTYSKKLYELSDSTNIQDKYSDCWDSPGSNIR